MGCRGSGFGCVVAIIHPMDGESAPETGSDRGHPRVEHGYERLPIALRPGDPEHRWPVLIALVAAVALQLAVPPQHTIVPRWPLVSLEVLLLGVLVIINPTRLTRSTRLETIASKVLLAAITLDNVASAVVLDHAILSGRVSNDPAILLGSGTAIFLTNIIAFGIWYWNIDRGGPFARAGLTDDGEVRYPDFMFPQTENPHLAPADWTPRFADYLYVSFTNVVAFSPTDAMPMTRRAKTLMALQATVAISTLALVIARAVNVLG